MKLYIFLNLSLFIQVLFLTGTTCSALSNLTEIEPKIISKDSMFKTWLKDSLNIIKNDLSKEKENSLGLNSVDIKVGQDSLSVEVIKTYKLSINSKVLPKVNDNIKYVIELLKNYNELPNKQFIVSFITSNYYSPSSAQNLIYDILTEIRELKIIESTPYKVSCYTYIRGRLNDKQVIEIRNGKDVKRQYNFIWKDNHLIKEELK